MIRFDHAGPLSRSATPIIRKHGWSRGGAGRCDSTDKGSLDASPTFLRQMVAARLRFDRVPRTHDDRGHARIVTDW